MTPNTMQNTAQKITIDEQFRDLLPALDNKTLELLEANLLENGCRDSLVLWENTLIDGHNRYDICMKHEIPFKTINKDFDSREDVVIWIITTQVSRRNLNARMLSYYRGLHYRTDKLIRGSRNQSVQKSENGQNALFKNEGNNTAKSLARHYNVDEKTVRRDAKGSETTDAIGEVTAEAKRMILANKVKIDKGELEKLAAAPHEEIKAVALAIENGTYEKRRPEPNTTPQTAQQQEHGDSSTPSMPGATGEPVNPDDASGHASANSPGPTGTRVSDVIIRYIANGVFSELRSHSHEDTQVLKEALRSCIGILEEMHGKLQTETAIKQSA